MKLDDKFTLTGSTYEWTLVYKEVTEEINEKTGKPITRKDDWHYPSLRSALKKYVDESLKPSETVQEILSRLDELEELIDNLRIKEE